MTISLEQRTVVRLVHYKKIRFPKLGASLLHVRLSSCPLQISSWKLGLTELAQENVDTLPTVTAVNNKDLCL